MKIARVLLCAWTLALAAITLWVVSHAAASTPSAPPSARQARECCPPDCCVKAKYQTVVKKTDDCCQPTCCTVKQQKSVPAKQECCSSGGCCGE